MEGRVEIYCGQGRGKTSCAIGQCVKAAGQEKQIIMVQFLKGKETEELSFFKRLEPEVQLFRFEKYERLYERQIFCHNLLSLFQRFRKNMPSL